MLKVNILIIEPEDRFFDYCSELSGQIAGGEGNFILSQGDMGLPVGRPVCVHSVYDRKNRRFEKILFELMVLS